MYSPYKGQMEIAVWRKSDGNWYISTENLSYADKGDTRKMAKLGGPNDIPVPADYDGDGKANIAVWKPATGEWQILDYNGQKEVLLQWGQVMNRDDTPVPANYRHTKKAQLAVFRQRDCCEWWISSVELKSWHERNKTANYKYELGKRGDIPVPADYNNDGYTELGVYNPQTCIWSYRTLKDPAVTEVQWGQPGDIPVPGQYFNRKHTDIACYRPSTHEWHIKGYDPIKLSWAEAHDVPMQGDYTGNGKTDIVLYRPSTCSWYIYVDGQTEPEIIHWGLPGETPVCADYGMKQVPDPIPAGHGARHAKFVRMFDLPPLKTTPEAMAELGKADGVMQDDLIDVENNPHPSGDNEKIPAAYTYFGQFIDHDITFDPTSSLDSVNDPELIRNFRTPRLELDNVYGMGPEDQPYLYNKEAVDDDGNKTEHAERLLFGSRGNRQGDLLRNDKGTAIIGDMRNDENLAVAQIQLAFIKFHNCVVERVRKTVADSAVFGEAQRIVRWHYQWMVIHDYLERICGPKIVNDILNPKKGRQYYLPKVKKLLDPDMPIEFSVAAYRFGHSQVRQTYNWNKEFSQGSVEGIATMNQLFTFTKAPVPKEWNVEFERLLDVDDIGDENVQNKTRKIDTRLSAELLAIPGLPAPNSLAERNLKRGLAYRLPSGQTVADHMKIAPLDPTEIPPDIRHKLKELNLLDATPLWYYILLESQVRENGERLGEVGATIVAEVMIGLIQLDPDSFLNAPIPWTPTLPSRKSGHFTLADMVNLAGWARRPSEKSAETEFATDDLNIQISDRSNQSDQQTFP